MQGEDEHGSLTVLRVEWDASGTGELAAFLRVRTDEPESHRLLAIGTSLNYRVADGASPARCVGRRGFRAGEPSYVDCGNDAQSGAKTCTNCSIAEATQAGSLHHAHTRDRWSLDPDVQAHLDQPNVLYVALFDDGSAKVGTSTVGRRELRWAEQGAVMASVVATVDDGIAVRRLEGLVTTEVGLAQSVSVKRKLFGAASPVADSVLSARLDDLVATVHATLGSVDPSPPLSDDRWYCPSRSDDVWQRPFPYPQRLDEGTHAFSIEGVRGRVALVERPASGDRFVVDLAQLYGVSLERGRFEPDEVLVQDSLF